MVLYHAVDWQMHKTHYKWFVIKSCMFYIESVQSVQIFGIFLFTVVWNFWMFLSFLCFPVLIELTLAKQIPVAFPSIFFSTYIMRRQTSETIRLFHAFLRTAFVIHMKIGFCFRWIVETCLREVQTKRNLLFDIKKCSYSSTIRQSCLS